MIVIALLAALAPIPLEAESAFEHDAQTIGQWTAFRKWAADDALMFVPQPVNAQGWLKDRKDPAESVRWVAAHSYVSCDRKYAVHTGPWTRGRGTVHGRFTTVWRLQAEGWRWTYDAGEELPKAGVYNEHPREQVASCEGRPRGAVMLGTIGAAGYRNGGGRSDDGTLVWSWTVDPKGTRHFLAQQWTGSRFETVVEDRVAAPPGS